MKANADSHLLSSLVWIDQYNECNWLTAPIIFGKIHFLLISENQFFHEEKCNGMTSFKDFMKSVVSATGKGRLSHSSWYWGMLGIGHSQKLPCLFAGPIGSPLQAHCWPGLICQGGTDGWASFAPLSKPTLSLSSNGNGKEAKKKALGFVSDIFYSIGPVSVVTAFFSFPFRFVLLTSPIRNDPVGPD